MTLIGQSNFLQALGWAVLNSLWQMALLWIAYQVITGVFRKMGSSQRSSFASALLFSGFAWFLFTFFYILSEKSGHSGYASLINVNGNPQVNDWLETTLPVASVVYLLLLLFPLWNFIRNYRYVQVIRQQGLQKAGVGWRIFVQKVSAHMGIQKPVQVWISSLVSSPLTIGYLKPVILLPVAAVNHLSTSQIEAVILHELAHIRRYDYVFNLVSRMIQAILYFNPFVKAFARIIEREREKNCDEMVMQFQYEPHGYATALLTLEKAAQAPDRQLALAAAGAKKNELLHRVESILGVKKTNAFSFNKIAGVMMAILCFIAINTLLLLKQTVTRNTQIPGMVASQLSSPFLFFSDENEKSTEIGQPSIIHHTTPEAPARELASLDATRSITNSITETEEEKEIPNLLPTGVFTYISNMEKALPVLNDEEELQVKEALTASRKVLEEIKWKALEQQIADAMTTAEKARVEQAYREAAENSNWSKMEEKLRLAYDEINWPEINTELSNAITAIRLDSVQHVYNLALAEISSLQKEMLKTNQKGIPDTDITVADLEKKRNELRKVVNQIKLAKTRKVIHL